jgi:hypothetical protein
LRKDDDPEGEGVVEDAWVIEELVGGAQRRGALRGDAGPPLVHPGGTGAAGRCLRRLREGPGEARQGRPRPDPQHALQKSAPK